MDFNRLGTITRGKFNVCIFINPLLNYKQKLFTLAHEIGHYCVVINRRFKTSKNLIGEEEANLTALEILKIYEIPNYESQFNKFYKWAVNWNKRNPLK